jgi:hypothetical protein
MSFSRCRHAERVSVCEACKRAALTHEHEELALVYRERSRVRQGFVRKPESFESRAEDVARNQCTDIVRVTPDYLSRGDVENV